MIQYYDVPRSLFLEVFPVGLGSRHFIVILPKIVWKVHFAFYNQKAVKKKEQEWELNQTPLGTNVGILYHYAAVAMMTRVELAILTRKN